MTWDFNAVGDTGGLIPADTAVAARIELRPGFNQNGHEYANATMSRSSGALYADLRLHIVHPPNFKGRVLFDRPGLLGKDGESDGFYAAQGRGRLRRYLESARGIEHEDVSSEAMEKRRVGGLADFHGLTVIFIVLHETDSGGVARMVVGDILTASDYPQYAAIANEIWPDGLPAQNTEPEPEPRRSDPLITEPKEN
jgi:hypothetical protein